MIFAKIIFVNFMNEIVLCTLKVVDMRWGVREDAANDHMATELCMRELKACQKLSTGPNFVVHK